MPGGDGTGPLGLGPMTGRGAGWCAGYGPAPMNAGMRGFGGGRGRGRRFRPGPVAAYGAPYGGGVAPLTAEQELQMLRNQAQQLQQSVEGINQRIAELEQQG